MYANQKSTRTVSKSRMYWPQMFASSTPGVHYRTVQPFELVLFLVSGKGPSYWI